MCNLLIDLLMRLSENQEISGNQQKISRQRRQYKYRHQRAYDFPEISPERVKYAFGLQVTISTDADSQEEGLELFKLLGFPIKNE